MLLYDCESDDLYDEAPDCVPTVDPPVCPLVPYVGLRWFCSEPDVGFETAAGFVAVVAFEALTLVGVLAVTLDADVLEGVLFTVALPLDCALDADDTVAVLPVLLAVAMPPLVDTLLVNTLSPPVLCLDPCQLSSFIWIGW